MYTDLKYQKSLESLTNEKIIKKLLNYHKNTNVIELRASEEQLVVDKLNLEEKRFCFCPEVTTKISKLGYQISEIPIAYQGRNYEEGKKIGVIDGFDAIKCLIKYKFIN